MPRNEPEVTTSTRSLVATGARVIHHSDAVDPKDWQSSTKADIGRPLNNPERLATNSVGRRQAAREAKLRAQIQCVELSCLIVVLFNTRPAAADVRSFCALL